MSEIQNAGHVYESVGACIYCGVSSTPLSDEHIIPFGLNGRLLLPKSSCGACALTTSKFEAKCLRLMLGRYREQSGLRTRHGKKRTGSLELIRGTPASQEGVTLIPAAECPKVLMLPTFPPPGALGGPTKTPSTLLHWTMTSGLEKAAATHGPIGVPFGVNVDAFRRMLAKIAHGFCVAALPNAQFAHFSRLLPGAILRGEDLQMVVGGDDQNALPASNRLHDLALHSVAFGHHEFLVCIIRLFAHEGAPHYYVAVGRRFLGGALLLEQPIGLPGLDYEGVRDE